MYKTHNWLLYFASMKIFVVCIAMLVGSVARGEVLAFIGAPLAVELSDKSCMDYIEQPDTASGLEEICMDRVFILKYEIQKVISGKATSDAISFIGFYHYWGMPNYTTYEPALIVISTEKGYLHLRYIERVEKYEDNWWVCQEWSESEEEQCTKKVKAQDVATKIIEEFR